MLLVLHMRLTVMTYVHATNASFCLVPEMLPVLLYGLLGHVLATDPAHLKPGALSAHLGRATLVEDVLWVQYALTPLVGVPDRLFDVTTHLSEALSQLQPVLNLTTFRFLHARLSFLNETLSMAAADYQTFPVAPRTKRGLFNGVGYLSRMIFGTAMQEDVDVLRDRYNHLLSLAERQNRAITLHSAHLALLDRRLLEIASYTDTLRSALNKVFASLRHTHAMMELTQAMSALEAAVYSLIATNTNIVAGVVDASQGRVTTSMFPIRDLLQVLDLGKTKFGLTPLFDSKSLQYYYTVLESFLTHDSLVIHVPFRSADDFLVFRIEPFPFLVNDTIFELDLTTTVVLINRDVSLYATGPLSDLTSCHTGYQGLFFCSASLFAFLPVSGSHCEVALTRTNAEDALEVCPYRHVAPKPMFHRLFSGFHYFFFMESSFVSVVCPNGSTYREVSGHLAVRAACSLQSAQLKTFPETLHQGLNVSDFSPVYPLTGLTNLSFSRITYVTNTLSELTFSNVSDFESAVQDSLPAYLSPYVHYPSVVTPVVVFVLIALPVCYFLRRALSLYMSIRARAAAPPDDAS